MTTYKRDLELAKWCEKIKFICEYQQGVFRNENRTDWLMKWDHLMNEPIQPHRLKRKFWFEEKRN